MPKGRPKGPQPDRPTSADQIAVDRLRTIVERIETFEDEIGQLVDDRTEVYKEAKAGGFDTKILRKIIQRRKRETDELAEEEEMIDLYERALRMGGNNPPDPESDADDL